MCKPKKITIYAQKQIKCKCETTCKFICLNNVKNSTKLFRKKNNLPTKTCRRQCKRRTCFRPLKKKVYMYKLKGPYCLK